MATVSMNDEEYAALASMAKASTTDIEQLRRIDDFLRAIEVRNKIERHFLWVQWQRAGKPLPVGTRFPEKWPPELRTQLVRFDRAWMKKEVIDHVMRRDNTPINVLCTRDPGGQVGWAPIDIFFGG